MLLYHGRKTARIKKFTDHQHHCPNCKAFDLNVQVYRDYYHIFFIPFVPLGDKTVKIRCNSCGSPVRSESKEKEYANVAGTPFYLYSILIFVPAIVIFFVSANLYTQTKKKEYVQNPQINDVYLIRSSDMFHSYSFYKIVGIQENLVQILHGKYEYLEYPGNFSDNDYFMKDDTLVFLKSKLEMMLDSAEINTVSRNYNEETGFNRVK